MGPHTKPMRALITGVAHAPLAAALALAAFLAALAAFLAAAAAAFACLSSALSVTTMMRLFSSKDRPAPQFWQSTCDEWGKGGGRGS